MVDHPLVDLLIIIMCGVICGVEKSEQIIKSKPSKSTVERVLDMVDGEEVAEVIIEIMKMKTEARFQKEKLTGDCKY